MAIVAATSMELQPLQEYLEKNAVRFSPSHFLLNDLDIDLLITGIGILNTTYSLMNYLGEHTPDIWLQAGIGGAIDTSLEIGKTYLIESEVLFDFGAQDIDGRILNAFQLGWMGADQFPYTNEVLACNWIPSEILIPLASGMTSIHAHGAKEKIDIIADGLHGQIENMEGAAFFYVSLMKNIPFLSLRSISNFVEPRDKRNWQMPLAINNLNEKVIFLLHEPYFISNLFDRV